MPLKRPYKATLPLDGRLYPVRYRMDWRASLTHHRARQEAFTIQDYAKGSKREIISFTSTFPSTFTLERAAPLSKH